MNITDMERIGGCISGTFYPGVGWLVADAVGVWSPITEEQAALMVMRDAFERANDIKAELIEMGCAPDFPKFTESQISALPTDWQSRIVDWKFWTRCADHRTVVSVMGLVEGVCTDRRPLDGNPWLLGTPSGVLDLRTGAVLPREEAKAARVTRRTAVDPAPSVSPAFLAAWECLPETYRDFVRWHYARALTGEMGEKINVQTGTGANGKTMLATALFHALGDYAVRVSADILGYKAAGSADKGYQLADLRGARMVYMEEAEASAQVVASTVKELVATPTIKARSIRKDPITIVNTWAVFLNMNGKPNMDMGDGGAARRLQLIEFPYKYVKDPDPERPEQRARNVENMSVWTASPEIQAEMLRYLLDVVATECPDEPIELSSALAQHIADNDLVGAFIEEKCILTPGAAIGAKELSDAFAEWLREGQFQSRNRNSRKALLERWASANGVEVKRDQWGVRYRGVRWSNAFDAERAAQEPGQPSDDSF